MDTEKKDTLNTLFSLIFNETYPKNEITKTFSPFLSSDISLKQYKQGQTCMSEGYAAEYFLIGLEGHFHIVKYNRDGRRLVVNPTNHLYGLCEILGGKPQFNASVVCTTDAICLRINAQYLLDSLKKDITLCQMFIHFLSELTYENMQRGDRILLFTDYENLLFYFSQLGSGNVTFPIQIEYTQKNIADILGINLRTLSRYLTKMKAEKKIDIINGRIRLSREQYNNILKEVNNFT